ncbi:uncharacterized protein B0T23DRAFT_377329 [Neurospora hispaniola]|uniref:Uncharacterized protein n=1 Tax=Neurospora hispaniola TaxID=588809 RepID=A0AAJ0MSN4_9PEZI|nr:hypothetical protein B0T23DRAFT_377329 [Neurospora hispaniola]
MHTSAQIPQTMTVSAAFLGVFFCISKVAGFTIVPRNKVENISYLRMYRAHNEITLLTILNSREPYYLYPVRAGPGCAELRFILSGRCRCLEVR